MADAARYEALRDLKLLELGLSTNDLSATNCLLFFNKAIKEYSRFRGIEVALKKTHIDETKTYILTGVTDIGIITNVYYNDSYPDDDLVEDLYYLSTEEENWQSLRLINAIRDIATRNLVNKPVENWWVTEDDATALTTITIEFNPETDIWIIYRKLYTQDNYPKHDEKIIEKLFEMYIRQWDLGTGQMRSIGNANYDNEGMTKRIKELRGEIYAVLSPMYAARG